MKSKSIQPKLSRFRVCVADPPWQFQDKLKMSDVKRGAEANYPVLGLSALCALPVNDWMLPDSVLALWVPSSMIVDGLAVMEAWGFQQKQIYTWLKSAKGADTVDVDESTPLAFGMGRLFRGCTEHALIGTKGKVSKLVVSKSERGAEAFMALPHSQKPETLQNRLERILPNGPYLELFARRARKRWVCVGDEAPGYEGVDIREWRPRIK